MLFDISNLLASSNSYFCVATKGLGVTQSGKAIYLTHLPDKLVLKKFNGYAILNWIFVRKDFKFKLDKYDGYVLENPSRKKSEYINYKDYESTYELALWERDDEKNYRIRLNVIDGVYSRTEVGFYSCDKY